MSSSSEVEPEHLVYPYRIQRRVPNSTVRVMTLRGACQYCWRRVEYDGERWFHLYTLGFTCTMFHVTTDAEPIRYEITELGVLD